MRLVQTLGMAPTNSKFLRLAQQVLLSVTRTVNVTFFHFFYVVGFCILVLFISVILKEFIVRYVFAYVYE